MNRQSVRFFSGAFLHIAILLIWIALFSQKLGSIPPPGRFFSPFEGFWRNAEIGSPHSSTLKIAGMKEGASVEYDHRGVPHVFARNLSGMFFAQGYVTARDRLWQMDVQSRAGLGRLSEVMGSNLIRFDLERRRMGMTASAKISLEEILKDPLARVALEAYSAGVNAWITSLSPAEYPFEFKLLDYAPEPWTPLKSVALLKNMQWTLSKSNNDEKLTRTLEKFGPEFFAELFPDRNPGSEPIFPSDVFSVPTDSKTHANALPVFGADGNPPLRTTDVRSESPPLGIGGRPQPGAGSNNFVLAGNRTASGHPILANDPHLDLTLPSLWYELQLQGGDVNAYGVSVTGLPGLVIGFNKRIAWGLTNGMDDVFDWYKLRFKDGSFHEYFWNGRWMPVRVVMDTVAVRGRKAVIDTQLWTHLGPVPVKNGERPFDDNTPVLHALRWTALDSSNELGAFLRLLPSENYTDFRSAIRGVSCPSQNFVFADSRDIALVHQGRIPVKHPGQGRTLIHGRDSTAEWHGFIPDSLLPFARNPAQGWLSSTNQEPTDSSYRFYLGAEFYPSERAGRLHRLLEPMKDATLDSAWEIMMSSRSLHAENTLPLLLRFIGSTTVSGDTRQAMTALRSWDFRYQAGAIAPVLFDLWWKNFHRHAWEDDFESDTADYKWPSRAVTRALLASDTNSDWFDDIRTQKRENAGDIARQSFEEAVRQSLRIGGGKFAAWSRFHPISIPHLLRLPSLGTGKLAGDGCAECLNAQRGSLGPSWRMAVELTGKPSAIGGYPGGQSGNPGSRHYDDFVSDWLHGHPYTLLFLDHAGESSDSIAYSLTLEKSK